MGDDIELQKLEGYFDSSITNGSRKTVAAGAVVDKHGRMMALKAFELAKKLEPRAASFGKYAKALSDPAAKGPASFLLTNGLLVKSGKIEE